MVVVDLGSVLERQVPQIPVVCVVMDDGDPGHRQAFDDAAHHGALAGSRASGHADEDGAGGGYHGSPRKV